MTTKTRPMPESEHRRVFAEIERDVPTDGADGSRPNGRDSRNRDFRPVAPIVTFTDEADAIQMANDSSYGLVSYVYTRDLARGLRVAEKLDYGMVAPNRGLVSDPAAPFGGTKQSGLGREGGHEGMLEYLEAKYIAVNW
jgi:succinate-semialdehyde dehydrogenase / glutarate-semialdehyde dehydrogenase